MPWLVEKRNDSSGIATYLANTQSGCDTWVSQRHRSRRFPTKDEAEKAAGELSCKEKEDDRIIVREETPSDSRSTLT